MEKKYIVNYRRDLIFGSISESWPSNLFPKILNAWYNIEVDYTKQIEEQFLKDKDYYTRVIKAWKSAYKKCRELYLFELCRDNSNAAEIDSSIKFSEGILDVVKNNIYFVLRGLEIENPGLLDSWFDKKMADEIRAAREKMNYRERSYEKEKWPEERDKINRYTRQKFTSTVKEDVVFENGDSYDPLRQIYTTRADKSRINISPDDFLLGWYSELKEEGLYYETYLEKFKEDALLSHPACSLDYYGVLVCANRNSGETLFPDLSYNEETTLIQTGESAIDAYFSHLDEIKKYMLKEYVPKTPVWYERVLFTTLWQK